MPQPLKLWAIRGFHAEPIAVASTHACQRRPGARRTGYAQEAFIAPRIRAGSNCCCNPFFEQRELLQKAAWTFSLDNSFHDKSVCTSDTKIPGLPQEGQS